MDTQEQQKPITENNETVVVLDFDRLYPSAVSDFSALSLDESLLDSRISKKRPFTADLEGQITCLEKTVFDLTQAIAKKQRAHKMKRTNLKNHNNRLTAISNKLYRDLDLNESVMTDGEQAAAERIRDLERQLEKADRVDNVHSDHINDLYEEIHTLTKKLEHHKRSLAPPGGVVEFKSVFAATNAYRNLYYGLPEITPENLRQFINSIREKNHATPFLAGALDGVADECIELLLARYSACEAVTQVKEKVHKKILEEVNEYRRIVGLSAVTDADLLKWCNGIRRSAGLPCVDSIHQLSEIAVSTAAHYTNVLGGVAPEDNPFRGLEALNDMTDPERKHLQTRL